MITGTLKIQHKAHGAKVRLLNHIDRPNFVLDAKVKATSKLT